MRKKTREHDYGQLLVIAAVIVAAPRWAGAFVAADSAQIPPLVDILLQNLNWLSGLGMGVIEVLGTAYMLTEWRKIKPKARYNSKSYNRQWVLLTGFIVGLFILTPLILSPYMVARMNGTTVAEMNPLWFQFLWNTAVVLSPTFIIGGVAIARDGLVGVKKEKGIDKSIERVAKEPKPLPAPIVEVPKEYSPGFNSLSTREQVLVFVKDNPTATYQKISEASGVTPARVGQLVRDMEKRGTLSKNGEGFEVINV